MHTKIKQHARVAAQSLLATFFVALVVVTAAQAATTIGNNISTGTVTSTGRVVINGVTSTSNTPLAVDASTSSSTFAVYQRGAGDILNLFDGATEVFTVLDGGKVGVGSSTPYGLLSVEALGGSPAFIVGSSTNELLIINATGAFTYNTAGSPNADFTVEGDAQANLLQVDASADRVGIASSTPYAVLSVEAITGQQAFIVGSSTAELFKIDDSGAVSFNGGGWADADFTVQGDTLNNLVTVDASADRVGIASTTPWGLLAVEQATETHSFIVMNQGSTTPSFVVNGVNGDGRVGIASSSPSAMLGIGDGSATSTIDTGKVCFRTQTESDSTIYWWFSTANGGDSVAIATSTTSCF